MNCQKCGIELFVDTVYCIDCATEIAEKCTQIAEQYFDEGKRDLTIGRLTRAIKVNGTDGKYYSFRGLVYYSVDSIYSSRTKEQVKKAIEDFKKAIELRNCDNIKDYYWLVKSYHQLQDFANRDKYFQKILELDPERKNEYTERIIHFLET